MKNTFAITTLLLLVNSNVFSDSAEPQIKTFHFSNVLQLGMRESVQCTVMSGDPPFEFSWLKDGRPLVDLRDVSIRKSDDFMSTLVITKVNADSNGNYTCRVSNSAGYDEKSAVLSAKVKSSGEQGVPKINPFHFSGELDVGMRASVQCAVIYGDPPFEFSWSKDGHKLMDVRSVSIRPFDDFTSTLVIAKVDADSNGNYSCKAANSKGFDEKSALLLVKDGHNLVDASGVSIGKFDDFTSNLVISKVDADSNGNYTCRVSNSKGFDEKSAELYVKDEGIPKIGPFHFHGELVVGMRTSVLCAVIFGDPPFDFTWLKDGQKLSETRSISVKTIDDFTSNLAISKVDANSNGNYTCRASNSKGFDEKSALLSVKADRLIRMKIFASAAVLLIVLNGVFADAPKLSPMHFPNELDVGMRASVHCIVIQGDPPFQFSWLKDGQPLMEKSSVSVRKTDDFTSNMVIAKVDAGSNGNYTCTVTNSNGSDLKSVVLSVKAMTSIKSTAVLLFIFSIFTKAAGVQKPEIRPFHFTGELLAGKRIILVCFVMDGDPPFQYRWYKDGIEVGTSGNVHTRTYAEDHISYLIISQLDSESNGNYTCRVSNTAGMNEHSALLLMKGRMYL
ncbi:titin [Trichonephila clavipes]|uniref:Titin n=1 Tax=Trichonephila clavipes TaxID=2585209 RepID=A0A8X6SPR0_TRICX|nr:titin [Trichonephila clavipes]